MSDHEQNRYTTHREVWDLLPWYVNGSTRDQEKALIKTHLEVCLLCKKELLILQKMATAVRESPTLSITPEASYARLLHQIQEQSVPSLEQTTTIASLRVPHTVSAAPALPSPWWRQYSLAIAAGLAGLLVVPIILLKSDLLSNHPNYHTLASHDNLSTNTQHDLHIVFTAEITQERIKQTLAGLNGQIIAGPNELGMYTIRLQADKSNHVTPVATALAQLRQQSGIIMAEPVLPPP